MGFLNGLIQGYAGQLEKKKDLEFAQEKEDRNNRIQYVSAAISSGNLTPAAMDAAMDELGELTGSSKGKKGKSGGIDVLKRLVGQFGQQTAALPQPFEQRSQGAAPGAPGAPGAAAPAGDTTKGGTPPAGFGDVPTRPADLAAGQTEAGNIDLFNRPVTHNPDGTTSSVRSIGIEMDGKHYLIPTVSDDGRIMSDDEAVAQFKKTGKHLGVFKSDEAADAYGQKLHEDYASGKYGKKYQPGTPENAAAGSGDKGMGEPPKRKSIVMTPEEKGKADLAAKKPALDYEHQLRLEEEEARLKSEAERQEAEQDRIDARTRLAQIHSDQQLQMRQTFETIKQERSEKAADMRQTKSLAQQWALTDKKEAKTLEDQTQKQLVANVKGVQQDFEKMEAEASRSQQQAASAINREGLMMRAATATGIASDPDMDNLNQQLQNIRDAKEYWIAHAPSVMAGKEDYDDVYAQSQLIIESGRQHQVGDIVLGPDNKKYKVLAVLPDGSLKTAPEPGQ